MLSETAIHAPLWHKEVSKIVCQGGRVDLQISPKNERPRGNAAESFFTTAIFALRLRGGNLQRRHAFRARHRELQVHAVSIERQARDSGIRSGEGIEGVAGERDVVP